jgi:hypothetical protein
LPARPDKYREVRMTLNTVKELGALPSEIYTGRIIKNEMPS